MYPTTANADNDDFDLLFDSFEDEAKHGLIDTFDDVLFPMNAFSKENDINSNVLGNFFDERHDQPDMTQQRLPDLPNAADDPLLGNPGRVTPEYNLSTQTDQAYVELQLECKRTLKKLAKSMQRSDETRKIIGGHEGVRKRKHIFEDSEMEQSRKQLYRLVRAGKL